MSKDSKTPYDDSDDKELMKNWRAWGSWFSWGSPVGLGIFIVAVAGAIWILAHL